MKETGANFLVAFLLIVVTQVSCGPTGPTPGETRAACRRDFPEGCCAQSDCQAGAVCDFSFVCALAVNRALICDAPTGDRKCHQRCDPARSCPAGQTCKTMSLFDASDTGESVSICAGP